jgi:hypothetical protein
MLDEILNIVSGNLVLGMPVLEAVICGHRPQVVRVPADDPRARLRVVFPVDTAMYVKHR